MGVGEASQFLILVNHRCPTYQLHLPRKRRFGDPKSPLQGNACEIRGNSGLPVKEFSHAEKKADPGNSGKFILGLPNRHFGMIFLGG